MLKQEQLLLSLRTQIDVIDEQIIHLLAERVGLARQTGRVKAVLRAEQQMAEEKKTEDKKTEDKTTKDKALHLTNNCCKNSGSAGCCFIKDQQREELIIKKIAQLAAENQLAEKFCIALYQQIINYCIQVQLQDINNNNH